MSASRKTPPCPLSKFREEIKEGLEIAAEIQDGDRQLDQALAAVDQVCAEMDMGFLFSAPIYFVHFNRYNCRFELGGVNYNTLQHQSGLSFGLVLRELERLNRQSPMKDLDQLKAAIMATIRHGSVLVVEPSTIIRKCERRFIADRKALFCGSRRLRLDLYQEIFRRYQEKAAELPHFAISDDTLIALVDCIRRLNSAGGVQ